MENSLESRDDSIGEISIHEETANSESIENKDTIEMLEKEENKSTKNSPNSTKTNNNNNNNNNNSNNNHSNNSNNNNIIDTHSSSSNNSNNNPNSNNNTNHNSKYKPTKLQPMKALNPIFFQPTPPRLITDSKTSHIIDTTIQPIRTSSLKEENNHISLDNKMGSGRKNPLDTRTFKLKRNKRFQSYSPQNYNTGNNTEQKENDLVKDQCMCVSCGMSFKHVCNLKSHFITVHNMVRLEDEHMYLTNFLQSPKKKQSNTETPCRSIFNKDNILKETNLDLVYGRQRPIYICKQCDKPFKFEINLETHLRCVHYIRD